MTDPPPKKVGSLRDRIAAFENKGAAPTPAAPPIPRPKPAHVTWQPKPASPPSSPTAKRDSDDGGDVRKLPGMSAADAKESIGKLSLKERMAALQGSTAFGGPASGAPPPRPTGEKPKWKPPPVVHRVEPVGGEEEKPTKGVEEDESKQESEARSPPATEEQKGEETGAEVEAEAKEEGQPDPEDEEKQRRAALVARMARLGGARVGMGPPIFGKKPDVPPKRLSRSEEKPKEEEKPVISSPPAEATPEVIMVEEPIAAEPVASAGERTAPDSKDYFPAKREDSAASSTLSPDSSSSTPARSPHMPVPLGPKRAAPPRKRPAKSPSPAPRVLEQDVYESPSSIVHGEKPVEKLEELTTPAETIAQQGDREPEVAEGQIEHIVEKVALHEPSEDEVAEGADSVPETAPKAASETHEEEHVPESSEAIAAEEFAAEEGDVSEPAAEEAQLETHAAEQGPQPEEEHTAEPEPQPEEERSAEPEVPAQEPGEEEEEAAHRKRIAERLAKSGGFNPFAGGMPPPTRRDSAESPRSPPARRDSQQEAIVKSPSSPATSPKSELPERKASVGSVRSIVAEAGLESPVRRLSKDVGIPEVHRAIEQSIHHEESIEETREWEDAEEEQAETRGEHEADHDGRTSLAHEWENEEYEDTGDEDHEAGRETVEEPENYQDEEDEDEPIAPPPPPSAHRPPSTATKREHTEADDDVVTPPPPPSRNFLPPPLRAVVPPPPRPPVADEDEEVADHAPSHELDESEDAYAQHAREVGPEHEDQEEEYYVEDDEYEHPADLGVEEEPTEDEHEVPEEDEYVPPPPPTRRTSLPPPPPLHAEAPKPVPVEVAEDDEPAPPPPPPRFPPRGSSLNVPAPAPAPALHPDVEEEPAMDESYEPEDPPPPPPPIRRQTRPTSVVPTPPPASALGKLVIESPDREVLDDSDVDPIDPEFYSPQRSGSLSATSPQVAAFPSLASPPPPPPPPARVISPPLVAFPPPPPPQRVVSPPPPPPPPQRVLSPPPAPEQAASPPSVTSPPPPPITVSRPSVAPLAHEEESKGEDEEGGEQGRRRTIAERMAKLGGIRFGAPPPVPAVRRAPPSEPEDEHEEKEAEEAEKPAEPEEAAPEEEEDEFARKQRIAARIAGMGGMRFGMFPGAAPSKAPPRAQREEEEEQEERAKSPPPPKRSAPVLPPPPPPPAEDYGEESDYQHVSDSDHAGHEESELEEVTYTDAEEEAPPPVPDRVVRRSSTTPLPPVPRTQPFTSRPPVPTSRPTAPAFTYPPPPHVPPPPAMHEAQGDFVVIDQPGSVDEPPPPPPPRSTRPPPRAPPRVLPSAPGAAGSQLQAPAIPSIDFGGETDLSLSGQWSEDDTAYPSALPSAEPAATQQPQPPARAAPAPSHPPAEQNLTSEELMAHWGRVGVQVHETAAALFDKSKKSLIGDGSYLGFVHTVLGQVPNAAQPTASLDSFGYLSYSQSASAVQRRASDIMPGDIIVISEAKFKGHKGLQSYNQTVGVGEPLVGVIGDFEAKKSKVKVYQANQHVGQQSVESVSYRLEDLKNGSVKIFRVLEA